MNTKFASKLSAIIALVACVMLPTQAIAARHSHHVLEVSRPDFPVINLSKKQFAGQDAVTQLGGQLGKVAKWYDKTPEQLQKMLLKDKHLRVDNKGRLFVVDEIAVPLGAGVVIGDTIPVENTTMFLEQTFFLHSHPGASRTVYLDFNGATLTGTAWNSNGNTINAKPYDIDGNPNSFSAEELQRIQYMWQRVAEDYAPFDVDVTTEAPPPEVLARSNLSDPVFGTTVLITNSAGVYDCSCGGVAYVGVFNSTSSYYKPALVFYDKLAAGSEKSVAEAISHELGHNVGLHHDGTSTSPYYLGHGTDKVTGWAPIMGVGYYKPLVQFSIGEYVDANNYEDDFVVMQSFGLPLRPDDYGSSIYNATPFTSEASVHNNSADGVIEFSGDRDVFSVTSGAGPLIASVIPATRSPNTDLVLTLIAANGQVLAVANPTETLSATINFNLPTQGTYYLEVRGGAKCCTQTDGYSNYGSVGNFRLTVDHPLPTGTEPLAKIVTNVTGGAAPLTVNLDGSGSTDDSKVMFWYWDFGDGDVERSGTMSAITHIYRTPGTYYAKLTVVDDTGLINTIAQPINVKPEPAHTEVQNIQLSLKVTKRGSAANARVVIVNNAGVPIRGATVNVAWTGLVNKSVTTRTKTGGLVSLKTPTSNAKGCFNIKVVNVTVPGYVFDPSTLSTGQICN